MFQQREVKRGKGRFFSPARSPAPVKNTAITVFALPGPTSVTPKGGKELEFSRAGLGRKVIPVSEDSKHLEVLVFKY
ncbi:hypothetical protein N1851_027118 [Merluccius polli]|uniref:Uncharacterized protein n=1 Tax=Merluccius polli TaxID=89951 RepID=A0AA47NSF6_MERPO|nr:hypothetical protein N1851_031097 [Merluccius polli]KAK0136711.1 hypothetical protein N1851_027118 [Merluccius polli]